MSGGSNVWLTVRAMAVYTSAGPTMLQLHTRKVLAVSGRESWDSDFLCLDVTPATAERKGLEEGIERMGACGITTWGSSTLPSRDFRSFDVCANS